MKVLVDSSIWIDYFRSGVRSSRLDELIDEDLIVTNELILVELIPVLRLQKQRRLIRLLETIRLVPIEIGWSQLTELQVKCLRKGINRIGIPDLIIAQQAMGQNLILYTLDKHFQLLKKHFSLALF